MLNQPKGEYRHPINEFNKWSCLTLRNGRSSVWKIVVMSSMLEIITPSVVWNTWYMKLKWCRMTVTQVAVSGSHFKHKFSPHLYYNNKCSNILRYYNSHFLSRKQIFLFNILYVSISHFWTLWIPMRSVVVVQSNNFLAFLTIVSVFQFGIDPLFQNCIYGDVNWQDSKRRDKMNFQKHSF